MNVGEFFTETTGFIITETGKKTANSEPAVMIKNIKTGYTTGYTEKYIEENCNSSQAYTDTKRVTRTELNEIIRNHPGTAMSVSFNKLYDRKDAAREAMAYLNSTDKPTESGMTRAITLKGEDRTMVGTHENVIDEHGRLQFFDAEDSVRPFKTVDLRTTYQAVLLNTKYVVK